jgi:hypothetical protein
MRDPNAAPRDPTSNACPDYTHPRWDAIVNANTIAQADANGTEIRPQRTREEVIAKLEQTWAQGHKEDMKEWRTHLDNLRVAEEDKARQEEATRAEALQAKAEKRQIIIPNFDDNAEPSLNPALNVQKYAIDLLRSKKFVSWWYWTNKGMKNVSASVAASADDLDLGNGFRLQSNIAKPDSRAVDDKLLTLSQLTFAMRNWADTLVSVGYPLRAAQAFSDMLQHLLRETDYRDPNEFGDQIIIEYAAEMHAKWHRFIIGELPPFNPGRLSFARLDKIKSRMATNFALQAVVSNFHNRHTGLCLHTPFYYRTLLFTPSPDISCHCHCDCRAATAVPTMSLYWYTCYCHRASRRCARCCRHVSYRYACHRRRALRRGARCCHCASHRCACRCRRALCYRTCPCHFNLLLCIRYHPAPCSCSMLPTYPSLTIYLHALPIKHKALAASQSSTLRDGREDSGKRKASNDTSPNPKRVRIKQEDGVFASAQRPRPSPASSAWAPTPTTCNNAGARRSGTTSTRPPWNARTASSSSEQPARAYALTTTYREAATPQRTASGTRAPDVGKPAMELEHAVFARRKNPLTPLNADAWERLLKESGLATRYPSIVPGLRYGFSAGYPSIHHTYCPPNPRSLLEEPAAFNELTRSEFCTGRWLGPVSHTEVECLLGPYQSSPTSTIPKPSNPAKQRVIQNYSSPRQPIQSFFHGIPITITSINSSINASDFPCTWGTFGVTALLIWFLPPGSQIAVRDVAEAFRSIPLHPSQWPAAVIRLDDVLRAIDTCAAFGSTSAPGLYGLIADAGCDLFRWVGIAVVIKWVDDHLFARIQKEHLLEYNARRAEAQQRIVARSESQPFQKRCHIWWEAGTLPNDSPEIYAEDMAFPLRDLSQALPQTPEDAEFNSAMCDIDEISQTLGICWGEGKTKPYANRNTYAGRVWDVAAKTVSLDNEKRTRYLEAVRVWLAQREHTLDEARKLHGRLQHVCKILP